MTTRQRAPIASNSEAQEAMRFKLKGFENS